MPPSLHPLVCKTYLTIIQYLPHWLATCVKGKGDCWYVPVPRARCTPC